MNRSNSHTHSIHVMLAAAAEVSPGPYPSPLDQTGHEFPFYGFLYLGPEKAQSQCVKTRRGKLGSFDAMFYSIWKMSLWRRENNGAKTQRKAELGGGGERRRERERERKRDDGVYLSRLGHS